MNTISSGKQPNRIAFTFARAVGALLLSLLVTGCPAKKPTAAPASDKVVIRGSNTIGEELAPGLIAEYKKEHPDVGFDLESKGTAYGFGNLVYGGCDIAAASRAATEDDIRLARDRGVELTEYVIGAYSVAIVVNSANPVANLTREQVRDLFTGVVTNWSVVGGPDAPVRLHIRAPISGTYLGFQELAMQNQPYAPSPDMRTSYAELVAAVARDPNGIGYASIQSAGSAGVKAVSIDGVAPTTETVNKGEYPYARVLRFYTKKNNERPAAAAFIRFVQSTRGQEIVNELGYTPHP